MKTAMNLMTLMEAFDTESECRQYLEECVGRMVSHVRVALGRPSHELRSVTSSIVTHAATSFL